MNQIKINNQTLLKVLSQKANQTIVTCDYTQSALPSEMPGNLVLIEGEGQMKNGDLWPFKLVYKTLDKWERYADPGSWRREHDLYASDFESTLGQGVTWPKCYHLESQGGELGLWMDYVEGHTGQDLSVDMFVDISRILGSYQGHMYVNQMDKFKAIDNLSQSNFLKESYLRYRNHAEFYDYIRHESCDLPRPVLDMLIRNDEDSERIWQAIEALPIIICHRDLWSTNVFYQPGRVTLIDWDTTGYGYMGEDIASLVADEVPPEKMKALYPLCIEAYYEGLSEHYDVSGIQNHCIHELILMLYGYRLVADYMYAKDDSSKQLARQTLEALADMKI